MVNRERLLKTFFDLVKIPGPPGEEDAIAKEINSLLRLFRKDKSELEKLSREAYSD